MEKFILGLLVGAVLGAGGFWFATRSSAPEATPTVAAAPDSPGKDGKKPKKRRGGRGGNRYAGAGGMDGVADEPIPELSAMDRRIVAQGDVLKVGTRNLDLGAGAPEGHELTNQEINGVFNGQSDRLVGCITDARGNAPVDGRVQMGVVVAPDGSVSKTRVEAPAYLLDHGLYTCARSVLRGLRFPAPGRDVVANVPFDVD